MAVLQSPQIWVSRGQWNMWQWWWWGASQWGLDQSLDQCPPHSPAVFVWWSRHLSALLEAVRHSPPGLEQSTRSCSEDLNSTVSSGLDWFTTTTHRRGQRSWSRSQWTARERSPSPPISTLTHPPVATWVIPTVGHLMAAPFTDEQGKTGWKLQKKYVS